MKEPLFGLPAEHRTLLRDQFASIHYQRGRVVVPIMLALCATFVAVDLLLIRDQAPSPLLWLYLWLDLGFLAFHIGFALFLFTGPPRVPITVAYGYVVVPLAWSVVSAAVEIQRTDNLSALMLAVLAVSALGLFSLGGLAVLIVSTLVAFVALTTWGPGFAPPGLEGEIALFALVGLAFTISRLLHGAVVNNLIANQELEEATAELDQVRLDLIRHDKLASLGVLSAGIAHEINNPLTFIKSNLSALERNHEHLSGEAPVLAENRAIFDEVKEGFRRIGEVVQALGTFGRDLPPGEKTLYDLNEGIRTTLIMTRHETQSGISITTDLADLPPIPARGSEINQVILNLLMNAFQAVHALPGGQEPRVTIRTKLEPDALVAEISNNGPPIPADRREKIFEPFFSTKAPGAGMGLGLSLSWQIVVQRHGGELTLDDGEPVTFRLRLPRSPRSM